MVPPSSSPYASLAASVASLRRGQRQTFAVLATVDDLLPGSGRVGVATTVTDLPNGLWDVAATSVKPASNGSSGAWTATADRRMPGGTTSGSTASRPSCACVRRAPVCGPGQCWSARAASWPWPSRVCSGRGSLPVHRVLPLSIVACILGLLGATLYYVATHPHERRSLLMPETSVQGFVLVAIATVLGGSLLLALQLGRVLDATAPGLPFGMTVGASAASSVDAAPAARRSPAGACGPLIGAWACAESPCSCSSPRWRRQSAFSHSLRFSSTEPAPSASSSSPALPPTPWGDKCSSHCGKSDGPPPTSE